ncbi:acetyl-coenzyme A carboxylase carboxyl transferase subunit alpha, chloroplastic-like [Argentina anserina]|uniref:acetyl-coenzyme A carboxylase carboxyl transferase subunit alpha, chloroplastic-like n=1 Tax=Argentina anserina TaxID=57926 RepID=UPI00217648D4|nr:acetyl-coenzyme A carboxylase carboxyl transferase subunit alpha, chloroplastic-like [Potentilla anserina]XP_050385957.1 acetyl-coenzyme A carboxylase carboxyl transferase subunit alpha, chloroplastic-like [Potentilla anserina]
MTTLSLIAGNCGRGTKVEDRGFQLLPRSLGRDHFACEFLGSSFTRANRIWFKELCRNKFRIIAKIKKGKKYDYPWPDDMDNINSGHLTYLSHFKPLTEKPKPVTLPFEKPLVDLEKKITEVRAMAEETGLDFSSQISQLENKYQQALKDLYTHLTPIQRLSIARHPNRPTVLDHIFNITEKWVELHGDRAGYDDPAIITGLGSVDSKTYMFIGHQKGRNTKENIFRNFAMPTPHGYWKALRMMKYADHHKFPIVTFVDTPGAFADLKSEELGQGEAIAHNLRAMFGLKVPVVTVVTGEGGSGGALAIGCANKMFMLENSAFYVASPEACAAILWKSSQAAPKAAEKLRITAQEHYRLKIADGIIPEPLGGAHADPAWTSQQIKKTIVESIEELEKMNTEELLEHHRLKFRSIGGFQEGIPVEPMRKRNMKPSEINMPKAADIESEIEMLKKKIIEAKGPCDPITSQAIEKIKQDVDKEITNAFISMGLQEKLEAVQLELSTASQGTPSQPLNRSLREKVDKIMQEFNHNLSRPGTYLGLKQKLEKLNLVNRITEMEQRTKNLKAEINQKIPAELKAKMELLKNAEEKISKGETMDEDLIEEVEGLKKELVEILKAANLEVVGVTKKNAITAPPEKEKIEKVNKEIYEEIERVTKKTGISKEIEDVKAAVEKGSSLEDREKAEAKIKQEILATMDVEALKEKVENLTVELGHPKDNVAEDKVGAGNGRF